VEQERANTPVQQLLGYWKLRSFDLRKARGGVALTVTEKACTPDGVWGMASREGCDELGIAGGGWGGSTAVCSSRARASRSGRVAEASQLFPVYPPVSVEETLNPKT